MSLDQDKNRHYSLRKLSVGLASVLIGISFVSAKGQVVKADNVKDNAKSAINEQAIKPEKQDMQSSILKGTSEPAKQNVKNVDMAGKSVNTSPVQASVNKENRSENSNSSLNSNGVSSLNKNMQTVQNDVPRENRAEVTSGQTATTQPTNTQDQTVITQPQKKQQTSSDQNSVAKPQKNLLDNLGQQKTSAQAGNQVEDSVQTQLQNSQKLDLTKNRQLAKKVLATNLIETNSSPMTNGGFDEATWGKLDVNDWQGSVQGDYYQLTDYTGDANHVIVPNEADFKKAGISTSGKQVGVTSSLMHTIFADKAIAEDVTVAFSKTDNKMVKAINTDWSDTWNKQSSSDTELSQFDGTNLDVSNVTDMSMMFFDCMNLSDINSLANWDTSNVTNMSGMFGGCFNLSDISALANWDTSKVTNMNSMFRDCYNNLSNISSLAHWDTSNVTDMSNMFDSCRSLSDISLLVNWNTSKVTNMNSMFNDCRSLSNISPLAHWDTSKVTDMSDMFNGCKSLSDISPFTNWNTSKVTNMSDMFESCDNLSDVSPLANWDTSAVTDMSNMFSNCINLSDIRPLANWDTSNVIDMSSMFENTPLKKAKFTNWDFSNIDPSSAFIFPYTDFEATLSDKTSKSLVGIASKSSDSVKDILKAIDSAPIVDGVPDVEGRIQDGLDSIKQKKEEYQQQLDKYKNQIDHYKKELADPNADAATKKNSQDELKQAEQKYQYYLTGDGKKSFDEQIQDLQGELEQYKQDLQEQINQVKLQAEYPLNSVFGNHSKITTPNRDLLVYLVGKLPVKSDTATRTIEITLPDGTKKTINQSIGYGQYVISGTADMVTHKLDMAIPYELSKWELSKKEDGSYDLVKAHVDKNGVASFDAVQLPKIPGYKAQISRIPSSNSAQPAMFLISFAALPSVNSGAQNTPDDTKQDQDAITDAKDLNTSNMQIVSNQPVLLENTDNNLQTLDTDTNASTWQVENNVADELIAPYVAFNSSHKLHLPRFNNYNLQIIKRTSNKDDLSFVYLDQNKAFKYVFNIKIEDGKYLLSISQIENKRLIPVQEISFNDYHQLIKLIVKLINK